MKKLLCLKVEQLRAFEQTAKYYSFGVTSPKLCSAFVTSVLIDSINRSIKLMEENCLVEVTIKTDDVNWFVSLDEFIYPRINSNLHVTRDSIYYSGAFAPDKEPEFVSHRLPLTSIQPSIQQTPKELNLALLASDTAKALISEIENLDEQMQVGWERQESLESLDVALNDLKSASIISKSSKTNELAYEVSIETKLLMKESEELEHRIEKKCEMLCKQILGISKGDRLLTHSYQKKPFEIQVNSVRYYDGILYLDGPKILKDGTLGKRNESTHITLVEKNERQ